MHISTVYHIGHYCPSNIDKSFLTALYTNCAVGGKNLTKHLVVCQIGSFVCEEQKSSHCLKFSVYSFCSYSSSCHFLMFTLSWCLACPQREFPLVDVLHRSLHCIIQFEAKGYSLQQELNLDII